MNLLEDALKYHDRGWCILPIAKEKKVRVQWKKYQTELPTKAVLRRWFGPRSSTRRALAVVCGAVSGGLAVRDFDSAERYHAWAGAHPDLALALPTVQTVRGFHVYFRGPECFHDFGDGEYRGDAGHYVLLPPSVHPTGPAYRWVVPLPDGPLPALDPVAAGLLPASALSKGDEGEVDQIPSMQQRAQRPQSKQRLTELTKAIVEQGSSIEDEVEGAIASTLPLELHKRNDCIFELARAFKGIPALAGAELADLRELVEEWHRRALPVIETRDFEATWADFIHGWGSVKFPKGSSPMELAIARAKLSETPAEAAHLSNDEIRLLAKICRELQRVAGNDPFFLSCRKAGEAIGMDHTTANRYLSVLAAEGLLGVVQLGGPETMKATRFHYTGQRRGKGLDSISPGLKQRLKAKAGKRARDDPK